MVTELLINCYEIQIFKNFIYTVLISIVCGNVCSKMNFSKKQIA